MLMTLVSVLLIAMGLLRLAFPKQTMRIMAEVSIRLHLVDKDKQETYRGIWIERPGVSSPGFQRRVLISRLSGLGFVIVGSIWLYFSLTWFN